MYVKCSEDSERRKRKSPFLTTPFSIDASYLIYNGSYGKFSGKIPNFSLPWQQGSSEQSLTDTIKLADLDNPLAGASIWGVSPAQAEL